ncbi:MAG: hypothetical protein M0Q95_10460 [Porticoccaceae bacterium]|nr:hypothetical protein [Porticoccaceae bacterium]
MAAHQHLDLQHAEFKHELCDACLLPHAANTPLEAPQIPVAAPVRHLHQSLTCSHSGEFIPAYLGRAPPL